MVNPNKKVKRPDGLSKIYRYTEDEEGKILSLSIENILHDNYVYLERAIKKENYYIRDNDTCLFFKELLWDDEVIGFSAYRSSNFNENSLVMQYFYVLEEYRQYPILIEEIDEASTLFESSILLEYPTRDMIDTLMKHNFTKIFEDRFIVSRIPFIMPMIPIEESKTTLREEYSDDITYRKISLIYDLDLCTIVGIASDNIENTYTHDTVIDSEQLNNYNVLSLVLTSDEDKYGVIDKHNNDSMLNDGSYFEYVDKIMKDNNGLIENWLTIL
ncbi:MAG: hypothetical protein LUG89_05115 [Methanosphaera sp.]|nr:hypothetical protein [Methanosphaera sp.]